MATSHAAWTTDADAPTISAAEHDAIQYIYQTVAEDYAPFDVNVTTQDPGTAALNRDSFNPGRCASARPRPALPAAADTLQQGGRALTVPPGAEDRGYGPSG
jgi:hypothetical protein